MDLSVLLTPQSSQAAEKICLFIRNQHNRSGLRSACSGAGLRRYHEAASEDGFARAALAGHSPCWRLDQTKFLILKEGDPELAHGNQVLAGQLLDYDPDKQFRQSDHTLENIFASLERVFTSEQGVSRAMRRIADYVVLDALIGNTDRHHENWGILRKVDPQEEPETVAPTFDHASSLGRELRDEGTGKSRRRFLDEGRIASYSEAGRGATYWQSSSQKGPSPLELLRCAAERYPDTFRPGLARLDDLHADSLRRIVARIPETWMSDLARTFAVELMSYNLQQIKSIST